MSQIANEIECAEDYTDNPEYQQWLEELAKECMCCPICWEVPCEGMAGGMCDEMCTCHGEDECDDETCFDEY